MLSKEEKRILEEAERIIRREEENAEQDNTSPYSNPAPGPEEDGPEYDDEDDGVPEFYEGASARRRRMKEYDEEVTEFTEVEDDPDEDDPDDDDVNEDADDTDDAEEVGEEGRRRGKKNRKRHPGLVIFLILLFLLLIAGAFFAFIYRFVGKTDYAPYEPIAEEESYNLPAAGEKGVMNILLIGTDGRDQQADSRADSRSDSIIVVSVCPKQKKIYMTSILRDSYVDIPGYGMNRINHAFQMGGPQLLVQTIEQNFGIRIDNYAKVDFYSFVDIVDAINGVQIDVTNEEVHYVNAYLSEINQLMGLDAQDSFLPEGQGGTYILNGRQALAYSRIRYIGTDFGRTARQRLVLQAAADRIRQGGIKMALKAGETVLSKITTDISDLEMTMLVFRAVFLLRYDLVSARIPYDGLWWNDLTPDGQEVIGINFESTRSQFRSMIYNGQ